MDANVVFSRDAEVQEFDNGTYRKILAYNEQLMIVEVHFETNAVGSIHTHPHLQSTYVREGRFRFTIGDETVEVAAGDSIAFPSGIPHGTVCLRKGVLLDIFTPMREDFLDF